MGKHNLLPRRRISIDSGTCAHSLLYCFNYFLPDGQNQRAGSYYMDKGAHLPFTFVNQPVNYLYPRVLIKVHIQTPQPYWPKILTIAIHCIHSYLVKCAGWPFLFGSFKVALYCFTILRSLLNWTPQRTSYLQISPEICWIYVLYLSTARNVKKKKKKRHFIWYFNCRFIPGWRTCEVYLWEITKFSQFSNQCAVENRSEYERRRGESPIRVRKWYEGQFFPPCSMYYRDLIHHTKSKTHKAEFTLHSLDIFWML